MTATYPLSKDPTWRERMMAKSFFQKIFPSYSAYLSYLYLQKLLAAPVSSLEYIKNPIYEPCAMADLIMSLASPRIAYAIVDLSDTPMCKKCLKNDGPCESLSVALGLLSCTRSIVHFV